MYTEAKKMQGHFTVAVLRGYLSLYLWSFDLQTTIGLINTFCTMRIRTQIDHIYVFVCSKIDNQSYFSIL